MENSELRNILRQNFGFDDFRSPQDEIIASVLDGRDTLAIMPTGGGKSLCYQLPALILDGITLVVSPLIALMKDQVDALCARGIGAAMINSSQSAAEQFEVLGDLRSGRLKLAYIAPERFRSRSFLNSLRGVKVSLFAIDEAHCISQWGHDFRPDYMRLGEALRDLGRPPCAAFTATATPEVKEDIVSQLAMSNANIIVSGFARPNLSFNVRKVEKKVDKYLRAAELIERYKTGIIYCATRKSAEKLSEELGGDGIAHVLYHGGMTPARRDEAQELFMNGSKPVAVATNAFGMGIDRSDIRFVCHYELPGSVEAFYQEAGRAGRDGLNAHCEMLFMYADKSVQEFFIDGSNPQPEIIKYVYRILRENSDNSYECFMPVENVAEELADIMRFERKGRCGASGGRFGKKSPSSPNPMAVSSAISILRRLGYIDRFDMAGKRTRGTRLLQPDSDEFQIAIDEVMLSQKRSRDEAKLRDVLRFAYSKECRQDWILRYFGENVSSSCGNCDNCKDGSVRTLRKLAPEEEDDVRKALSAIARMSRRTGTEKWEPRFGRDRVLKCMVGSEDASMSVGGIKELSTYGILKSRGRKFASALLEAISDAGLAETVDGEYPLFGLTELGARVMLGRSPCPNMDFPSEGKKARAKASVASKKREDLFGGTSSDSDEDSDDVSPEDAELYKMLVSKRNLLRRSMGNIPAYKIFPNAVLKQLACERPSDAQSAMLIKGIGAVKAEKFLPPFLEIIAGYRD